MRIEDWRRKLEEAVERIRYRYQYIGRKTGAPFLAVVFPSEVESAVIAEWRTLADTLKPEFDVRSIDILDVTQHVISEIGVENIVDSIKNPMPGSDSIADLGHLWTSAIIDSIQKAFSDSSSEKPVVSLERLSALYPAMGPRNIMQALWDSNQEAVRGPVVVLIPGSFHASRTYHFVDMKKEFMYRGDIL
ncbi:MAG: hypothetical protein GTO45_17710 [Candidatus Aminicenantes bacterium]|nr:hypothetical protein [Candidatus Aminicenantes bacterium]NIM80587.1 hypothetical protein [Candidatus Aminicenantes bacterium]NIN19968.1 hypothetical protein [Candidatus Aminicenantes bacterium]NIN42596.1 hypothetical protein [Candidatus Aminicenantes bacterium]NIN86594.1 hypothetical protein [Candidatus Aminicenantes bacterium]